MRVIIVGGGIAGLTMASALERANIDFVLLEARNLFDPQVGASIGIQASAMRILDQLGAAQEIMDQTAPIVLVRQRKSDGSLIAKPSPGFQLNGPRFGYGTMFLERQGVLRALNRSIASREKMLLNKTVRNVEHDATGVTVNCEDGTSYRGDIVVGCDGVNSKATIQSEMWRIAAEVQPGQFPETEKTKMTVEYRCLFGISTGFDELSPGIVDDIYHDGKHTAMVSATNGRVFWFVFEKLDRLYTYGEPAYPRYSKSDAEKVALENAHRPCHEYLTIGDLWEKRLTYTLVPTEEALYDHWSWGRMATVGDNAHKMTPNHGQSGNNAIESAAVLANHLKRIHDANNVTSETITTALRQWQAKRQVRVNATVKEAAMICRMQCLDSWAAKATVFWVLPYAEEYIASRLVTVIIGAEVLEYLPIPNRSLIGSCPFNPSYGVGQSESLLKRALFATPLLYLSYWIATKTSVQGIEGAALQLLQPLEAIKWLRIFSPFVDTALIYALWLLESARRANALTPIQLPILFSILNHLYGPGVIAPAFYFLHYLCGPLEKFAAMDMRLTDMAYTRTVLPLVSLWLCTPALLRLSGVSAPVTEGQWHWIWILVLPFAISGLQRAAVQTGLSRSHVFQDAMRDWNRDLPTLRRTVYGLGAVSGVVWAGGIVWVYAQTGGLSFQLESSLLWNWVGLVVSSGVWLGMLFFDLGKAGMLEWRDVLGLLARLAVGVLAGPAASIALIWLWREEILASRRHKDAFTKEKYQGRTIEEVEGRVVAKVNGHKK